MSDELTFPLHYYSKVATGSEDDLSQSEFYELQAINLADLLLNKLPSGTYDALMRILKERNQI